MTHTESTQRFQMWGVVVAVIGLIITNALTSYGLWIQNDALRTQIGLLSQQVKASDQRAAQLTIQDHALTAGVSRDLDNHNLEIQKLLFQNPRLYAYFYRDADPRELRSPDEVVQAQLVAEMFLDFMDAFNNPHIEALPGMKKGETFRAAWESYFSDLFTTSRVLCQLLKDKPDWWTSPTTKHHSETTCKKTLGASREGKSK